MSTITSVGTLLYKQIVPDADTGAITAFATVAPAPKFKLDTCSIIAAREDRQEAARIRVRRRHVQRNRTDPVGRDETDEVSDANLEDVASADLDLWQQLATRWGCCPVECRGHVPG